MPVALLSLAAVTPVQTGAQVASRLGHIDAWIDAGGARVEQPFRAPERAGVLGVGAARTGRTFGLSGQLAATVAGDSAGAGQGLLLASVVPPMFTHARTDAGASLTTFGLPSQGRGRNSAWLLRQSLGWRYGGAFATVGASRTKRPVPNRRDGSEFEGFRATSVDVGIFGSYRWLSASLSRQRTLSDDYQIAESTGFGLTRLAASYDYRDLVLNTGLAISRLELSGTFAQRRGGTATRGRANAVLVSASVQVTRSLSLVVSEGKGLADPLRGVPQAQMTSAGIRWRIGGSRAATRADAATLDIRPTGGAELTVRVRAARDARVEVATSHGEWVPSAMVRDNGFFVARVQLPSGTHRVAVRVNGGEWMAPAGLARVKDDLGGSAGLVVVP